VQVCCEIPGLTKAKVVTIPSKLFKSNILSWSVFWASGTTVPFFYRGETNEAARSLASCWFPTFAVRLWEEARFTQFQRRVSRLRDGMTRSAWSRFVWKDIKNFVYRSFLGFTDPIILDYENKIVPSAGPSRHGRRMNKGWKDITLSVNL
jgi:hypothetical protein